MRVASEAAMMVGVGRQATLDAALNAACFVPASLPMSISETSPIQLNECLKMLKLDWLGMGWCMRLRHLVV